MSLQFNPFTGTFDVTTKGDTGAVAAAGDGTAAAPGITFASDTNTGIYRPGADQLALSTNGTGRLFVDASGNVGVGTAPDQRLTIASAGSTTLNIYGQGRAAAFSVGVNATGALINEQNNLPLVFNTNNTERARIDSSGRLLVGTSSARSNFYNGALTNRFQVEGTTFETSGASYTCNNAVAGEAPIISLNKSAGGSVGSNTIVSSGHILGLLTFQGNDGTQFVQAADIKAEVDGTPGADDMPGRLVFSTTSDGQASPTPRMTIDSSGRVGIGTTSPQGILDLTGTSRIVADVSGATPKFTGLNAAASAQVELALDGSALAFRTLGAEKARIDSSGRLLVGTSSSIGGSTLQVAGTGGNPLEVSRFSASSAGPFIGTFKSRGATVGVNTAVIQDDLLGAVQFHGAEGTGYQAAANIRAFVDTGTISSTSMPGRLVFSTTADGAASPTERMRIYNDGRTEQWSSNVITFGTSSSQAAGSSNYLYVGRYGATGNAGGTTSFFVYTSGDVRNTNNSYGAISDIKLKENIVDANSQWDDIKALQVRNYNFKEGQTHTQIGLIAQEVELVSPGLVSESPDRDEDGNDLGTTTKSVNYSVLYMKAVKALQEAMERIETLEAKVAALESA